MKVKIIYYLTYREKKIKLYNCEIAPFLEDKVKLKKNVEEARAMLVGVKNKKVNRYRFVNSSVDEVQNTSAARIDDINTSQYVPKELGYSR